ncbi:MAG TPA: hypothetical protein VJW76_02960 [Verrucomicrobiae bacterium]|nr:hypothetical protein [Verrucomicrobiae bacterium]
MEPNSSRLRHRQEIAEQTTRQPPKQEFETVEEMIRQDASQTEPPAAVAERLADSISREPKPAKPWWRRFFT